MEPPAGNTYFPAPVHDVSEGLNFLTSSSSLFNHGHELKPKISLLGTRLGGGLAAMLALTRPNDVHAVTMLEPIVDWVGLDETIKQLQASTGKPVEGRPSTSKRASREKKRASPFTGVNDKSVLAAAEELSRLRSKLFKTPAAYFDPFASPLLFLRAAGRDTPQETKGDVLMQEMGLENIEDTENIEDESFGPYDDDRGQNSPGPTSSATGALCDESARQSSSDGDSAESVSDIIAPEQSSATPPQAAHPPRRRKVLQRWPSVGRPEDVLLPYTKIFLRASISSEMKEPTNAVDNLSDTVNLENGLRALLHAQGTEFAELMRRACFYGREIGFANERVKVHNIVSSQSSPSLGLDGGSNVHQRAVLWANEILKED
ncbi:uncharacterized protein A1O9_02719 [Exophiala aquamarina CBS 119918]|uniref:Uncharacterized protein n=1 Tax=Exophiala aquamarina CBS 119918 TaxID=1182545 RepID=A0A072PM31_9EURO|nr:uncharacterized protein A1O9_02719 [Exophiala aquamarina CBS 119918]KEF61154.1 hypothetical protein A1O9_02719 [Exophiala aquamarina CBS 119918]